VRLADAVHDVGEQRAAPSLCQNLTGQAVAAVASLDYGNNIHHRGSTARQARNRSSAYTSILLPLLIRMHRRPHALALMAIASYLISRGSV